MRMEPEMFSLKNMLSLNKPLDKLYLKYPIIIVLNYYLIYFYNKIKCF